MIHCKYETHFRKNQILMKDPNDGSYTESNRRYVKVSQFIQIFRNKLRIYQLSCYKQPFTYVSINYDMKDRGNLKWNYYEMSMACMYI